MDIKAKVTELVFSAVDQINKDRPKGEKIEKLEDTPLFNEEGGLDSLGMIDLIVVVEQKVSSAFKVTVALASEKTMNQAESPFKTVKTFIDYVIMLIQEA